MLGDFTGCHVPAITRGPGYRMCDLGPFTNALYAPEGGEYFYRLGLEARARIQRDIRYSNYACIDPDVAFGLYRRMYEDRVLGREQVRLLRWFEIAEVGGDAGPVRLDLREVNTWE